MEALIVGLMIYYVAKHGIEDLSFAVRGKTSPRQSARMARSQARLARAKGRAHHPGSGAARNYGAAVWRDSWQSAYARRQKRVAKRQARPSKAHPARSYAGRRIHDLHDRGSARWAAAWDRREQRYQDRRRNGRPDRGLAAWAVAPMVAAAEAEQDRREAQAEQAEEAVDDVVGTETPEADAPGPATPTTTEGDTTTMATSNGEVTGLQTAIAYAEGLADDLDQVPSNVEQLQASLQAGEVGNEVVAKFASIGEHAAAAAGEARTAAAELRSHLAVTEAYHSTGDQAGSKEFVTAE
jgi:hypothetical protein